MPDHSPELQRHLDDLRQRREDATQTRTQAEQARLERNRNAIDRLVRDARHLGELALTHNMRRPTNILGTETITTSPITRRTRTTHDDLREGWLLTWKQVNSREQGRKLGFITMLGTDCGLYAAETTYPTLYNNRSGNTVAMTDPYQPLLYKYLPPAGPDIANLGEANPVALDADSPDVVIETMEADTIHRALLLFAEENRLG